MSVLKDKRTTSKAEYVNVANQIYVKTVDFLSRVSPRYSRLIAADTAHLAGQVMDHAEEANKIYPSDQLRKDLRKSHHLEAMAHLSALDVRLSHCYQILYCNPQGAFTDGKGHKVLTKEVLAPLYCPGMIYDNGASQKGKGLHFHYKRLKEHLRWHYRRYGRTGAMFLMDFHHFFPEAPHALIYERHRELILDPNLRALADLVVAAVPGGVGMPLGVEPSQQEMVALPSFLDNWMKCQLSIHGMSHYMDDYDAVLESRERAERVKAEAIRRAEAKGLQVNRNKCHVIDLDKPFRFCKAKFQILPSGRIITHGCRDGMKRARRKLRYFRQQVDTGEKIVEQVAEWLKGPIAYYEQFNDHGRVLKLRRLYYALFIKGRKTEEVKPCIGS